MFFFSDEQYLKESYAIKENHAYSSQENYRMKHAEVRKNQFLTIFVDEV